MSASPPLLLNRRTPGFTLAELLVVISIIGVLAGLLLPAISRMRQTSKIAETTSRLKTIGAGLTLYAAENDNRLPVTANPGFRPPFWCGGGVPESDSRRMGGIAKYVAPFSEKIGIYPVSSTFQCPLLTGDEHHVISDFGANLDVFGLAFKSTDPQVAARSLSSIAQPGRVAAIMTAVESNPGKPLKGTWYVQASDIVAGNKYAPRPSDHNSGKILFVFVDGHVDSMTTQNYDALTATKRRELFLVDP